MNRSLSKKDKSRINSRKHRKLQKLDGYCNDGSSKNRQMAQATRFNMYRRIREEKENPYTIHPLSFEEFDNIPDIENLIKEKKMINICDECKMDKMDHTKCDSCKEPMCEGEDKIDMPEGWYHPDCHSDIYG